jgi:hypothetical protein
MRLGLTVLVACSLSSACAQARDVNAKQDNTALLDVIESTARLPDGASPLNEYDRFYTVMGDKTFIGIYVHRDETGPTQRRWVSQEEMPRIRDGGCSVVTIFFNASTRHSNAMCNPDPFR